MKLLTPVKLGTLSLNNRVVMAPMTRGRASADGVPTPMMATYYAQRASAGLIVSEATNITAQAIGSPLTPGIYTAEQLRAWQQVTTAVHDTGGRIFCQLWHTGRVGHSSVRAGALPVAPSAIPIRGQQHFTGDGPKDYEAPRVLSAEEVQAIVHDYGVAARYAQTARFDGVELHCAFGYLPNQFLAESSNQRTDDYGGSITNRIRFVVEVVDELRRVWGRERVGIKLSPCSPYNGITDPDPTAVYQTLLRTLDSEPLAYVHLMRPLVPLEAFPLWPKDVLGTFSSLTKSPVIANGGYDVRSAELDLVSGKADLVSFGTLFVSNPDLPARLSTDGPFQSADRGSLYGGGTAGYIDYPRVAGASSDRGPAHTESSSRPEGVSP